MKNIHLFDISIFIVNYNSGKLVVDLVSSIERYTKNVNYEIIIVDNNSTDSSKNYLDVLKNNKNVKIFLLSENVGFAKANNFAASHAKGKFFLLLNPDTLFIEDTLTKVMDFKFNFNKNCIIGIKLLNVDYTIQPSKQVFPNIFDYLVQAFFLDSIFKSTKWFDRVNYGWEPDDEISKVDAVKGAFFFVDHSIYEILNGLDDNFFIYTEEVDFCFRAKQKGIDCYYLPSTSLIHYGGYSAKQNEIKNYVEQYKNMLLFLRKHKSTLYQFVFRFILILATFNRIFLNYFLSLINKNSHQYRTKWRVYFHAFYWLITGKNHSNI